MSINAIMPVVLSWNHKTCKAFWSTKASRSFVLSSLFAVDELVTTSNWEYIIELIEKCLLPWRLLEWWSSLVTYGAAENYVVVKPCWNQTLSKTRSTSCSFQSLQMSDLFHHSGNTRAVCVKKCTKILTFNEKSLGFPVYNSYFQSFVLSFATVIEWNNLHYNKNN